MMSAKQALELQRRVRSKSKKAVQTSLFSNDEVIPENIVRAYTEPVGEHSVELEIMGQDPMAKQSARFTMLPKGQGLGKRIDGKLYYMLKDLFISSYQKKDIDDEKQRIRSVVAGQILNGFDMFEKQIKVDYLDFIFSPIQSLNRKELDLINNGVIIPKLTKPDTDNLEKMLWDALEGVVFKHDANIWAKNNIRRFYGNEPGIKLKLTGV